MDQLYSDQLTRSELLKVLVRSCSRASMRMSAGKAQVRHLEVGRRAREGLHIDSPLLRVQPESLQRSFLQHTCTIQAWTSAIYGELPAATAELPCWTSILSTCAWQLTFEVNTAKRGQEVHHNAAHNMCSAELPMSNKLAWAGSFEASATPCKPLRHLSST